MALSFEQFSGDGTNRQFPIDFGYLSRDHISVTVEGVAVAFTFLSNGLVQTAVAPAAGTVVEVRRTTPRVTPLTDFVDGSTLTEADLDTATLQTFYLAQEAYDIAGGTLGIQPDGSYSANNRRIGTVADPVGPQDVVNKRYFEATFLPQQQALLTQTTAQKEAAVAARTGSETALAAALAARDLALQYRDAAQGHRNAAETAKNDAYTYRTQAYDYYALAYASEQTTAGYRTAAQTAKAGAEQHEANAWTHRQAAFAWAEKTDGAVETGKYSAKAWANDAQQYRNTTLTYRNDAETFKNQAAASAAAAAMFDPSSYYTKTAGDARYPKLIGANAFDTRPTFNGATPFDTKNFLPSHNYAGATVVQTDNDTVPASESGRFYQMNLGGGIRTMNLPATSGLPDGWSCIVRVVGLPSAFQNCWIAAENGKVITYRGNDARYFYLIGSGETFRFTWLAGLGYWFAECLAQPGQVYLSRSFSGSSSWNSGYAGGWNILSFTTNGGSNTAFNTSQYYSGLPVTGVWGHRYTMQVSASAGGGATGFGYLCPAAASSANPDSALGYDFRNFVAGEDGGSLEVEWQTVCLQGQWSGAYYQMGVSAVWFFPASNFGRMELLSR